MTFNQDTWKATYIQAAKDSKGHGASDGIVCVLATLRYIRAGLVDDIAGITPDKINTLADEHDRANCESIVESLTELFKSCQGASKLGGFASNASGAAAFTGLKADKVVNEVITL